MEAKDAVNRVEILEKQTVIYSQKGMTALHHASAGGLKRCVEVRMLIKQTLCNSLKLQRLLKADAKINAENGAGEIACDIAERCGFKEIAEFLEGKTLFAETKSKRRNSVPEEDTYPVVEVRDDCIFVKFQSHCHLFICGMISYCNV